MIPITALLMAAASAPPEPVLTPISKPTPGETRSITIGDPLSEKFLAYKEVGAILIDDAQAPTELKSKVFRLPAGTEMLQIESSSPFKACELHVSDRYFPHCLIDDDGDGTFDRAALNDVTKAYPMERRARYRVTDVLVDVPTGGALVKQFRQTVIYQGSTSDTLKLSYREFSDDMARPAFTEEMLVPIGRQFPQQFAVKGLSFTILSLGPMGMTYRVDGISPTPAVGH